MIKQCLTDAQLHEKLRALFSALKLIWPKSLPVLEAHETGAHTTRTGFLKTFARLEHWSVTAAFVSEHPDLVNGMAWSPLPEQESPDRHSRVRVIPSDYD